MFPRRCSRSRPRIVSIGGKPSSQRPRGTAFLPIAVQRALGRQRRDSNRGPHCPSSNARCRRSARCACSEARTSSGCRSRIGKRRPAVSETGLTEPASGRSPFRSQAPRGCRGLPAPSWVRILGGDVAGGGDRPQAAPGAPAVEPDADQPLLLRFPRLVAAYARLVGRLPPTSASAKPSCRAFRLATEALNRRDLDAALIAYDRDREHHPPREFVEAGFAEPCYRGPVGFRKYMSESVGRRGSCALMSRRRP